MLPDVPSWARSRAYSASPAPEAFLMYFNCFLRTPGCRASALCVCAGKRPSSRGDRAQQHRGPGAGTAHRPGGVSSLIAGSHPRPQAGDRALWLARGSDPGGEPVWGVVWGVLRQEMEAQPPFSGLRRTASGGLHHQKMWLEDRCLSCSGLSPLFSCPRWNSLTVAQIRKWKMETTKNSPGW